MNEQEIKDKYSIGTLVNVKNNPECQNFTGIVVGHRYEFITVRDQNDDCWDCLESEISLCSDEDMH